MVERVDRRVLGAIRLLDGVTNTPVVRPMRLEADDLTLQRNRSGHYVVVAAEGLESHVGVFETPPAPPTPGAPAPESLSFQVAISDPTRAYLPALATVALPRRFDLAAEIRDLMEPIDIALASSTARAMPLAWASLRVTVEDTTGAPIRGALVEALSTGVGAGAQLGWGLSNDRGETLVPVQGLPAMREVENDPNDPDDNQIVTAETPVTIRATADRRRPWPVNLSAFAAGGENLRTANHEAVPLSPGRTVSATLTLDLS